MGKVTGFLEFQRLHEAAEADRDARQALPRVRAHLTRRGGRQRRARAAWIAAFRSA